MADAMVDVSVSFPGWWSLESFGADLGFHASLLLSAGLVASALLDRFLDGDGGDDGEDADPLGGDAAFGDALDDSLGDLDGMDDWDDAAFGDGEDEGESIDELERRIEELESELGGLSSTVGTVRSENEEISETVEDTEENVRKLLEIYEMVTRGINPFVDEATAGGFGGASEGGSLGLFDGDDGNGREEEGLDDDIANADPEGFFDEELLEPAADEDAVDAGDALSAAEVDDGSGKSFSDLKEEYDSVEADWSDDLASDEGSDGPPPEDQEGAGEGATADERGGDADGEFRFVDPRTLVSPSKPYLDALPDEYVGDLLVMEWLEYLVDHSDPTDAVRAVRYYEAVEWIDGGVADRLEAFLAGFGEIDRNKTDLGGTERLTLAHHTRSLKYITQLGGATAETVVLDRWSDLSGVEDGL